MSVMTERPDPNPEPGTEDGAARPAAPAPEGEPEPLPPDPEAYDSPRATIARARGLSAPYIAGGRDPEPEAGRREERFYGRLLLAMVLVIVLGGFVIGILAYLAGFGS
jgi:hypothetical protein